MRLKSVVANHIINNKKLSQTSGHDEFLINNITYKHEKILFILNRVRNLMRRKGKYSEILMHLHLINQRTRYKLQI